MSADDFIAYPTNRVVGTITETAAARRAVDALTAAGFDLTRSMCW